LPCSLFDIRVHFCKRRRAIQPDWRNLRERNRQRKACHRSVFVAPAMTPPSTSQIAPVTQDALSDNKKQTTSATSSGLPIRPIG
jgi:hypothetical protein